MRKRYRGRHARINKGYRDNNNPYANSPWFFMRHPKRTFWYFIIAAFIFCGILYAMNQDSSTPTNDNTSAVSSDSSSKHKHHKSKDKENSNTDQGSTQTVGTSKTQSSKGIDHSKDGKPSSGNHSVKDDYSEEYSFPNAATQSSSPNSTQNENDYRSTNSSSVSSPQLYQQTPSN